MTATCRIYLDTDSDSTLFNETVQYCKNINITDIPREIIVYMKIIEAKH